LKLLSSLNGNGNYLPLPCALSKPIMYKVLCAVTAELISMNVWLFIYCEVYHITACGNWFDKCIEQRCADIYPQIDILRISTILMDTDRIQISAVTILVFYWTTDFDRFFGGNRWFDFDLNFPTGCRLLWLCPSLRTSKPSRDVS